MVMGNHLGGEIEKGAMLWLNRRLGNPFLSQVLNLLFKTGVTDVHCGMRSFSRAAYQRMRLRARGMEFASEMLIEAVRLKLKIKEMPIKLYRASVGRIPYLRADPGRSAPSPTDGLRFPAQGEGMIWA